MPIGGGSPKRIGDGMVVYIRPDAGKGNADVWDVYDAVIALMEEIDKIYAALNANPANYGDFATALGAPNAARSWIQLRDRADGP